MSYLLTKCAGLELFRKGIPEKKLGGEMQAQLVFLAFCSGRRNGPFKARSYAFLRPCPSVEPNILVIALTGQSAKFISEKSYLILLKIIWAR